MSISFNWVVNHLIPSALSFLLYLPLELLYKGNKIREKPLLRTYKKRPIWNQLQNQKLEKGKEYSLFKSRFILVFVQGFEL